MGGLRHYAAKSPIELEIDSKPVHHIFEVCSTLVCEKGSRVRLSVTLPAFSHYFWYLLCLLKPFTVARLQFTVTY